MSKFIKLNSIIINVNYIKTITLKPNKCNIVFINNKITGMFIFSSGDLSSYDDEIEICKKQFPEDYKIISEWCNKLE